MYFLTAKCSPLVWSTTFNSMLSKRNSRSRDKAQVSDGQARMRMSFLNQWEANKITWLTETANPSRRASEIRVQQELRKRVGEEKLVSLKLEAWEGGWDRAKKSLTRDWTGKNKNNQHSWGWTTTRRGWRTSSNFPFLPSSGYSGANFLAINTVISGLTRASEHEMIRNEW